MNINLSTSTLAFCLGLLLNSSSIASATPASSSMSTNAAPMTATKASSFKATVQSMDVAGNSLTVVNKSGLVRVFMLTPTTVVIDGSGKPTTLSTAKVGESVSGKYMLDATSGKRELTKLRIGAKVKESSAAMTPAPAAAAGH